MGGGPPPLWPGDTQAVGFAITNTNSGSVYVNNVTIAVTSSAGDVVNTSNNVVPGCVASWFTVNGSPVALDQKVATGTTDFTGYASITLTETNSDQSACEGQAIGLTFSSN